MNYAAVGLITILSTSAVALGQHSMHHSTPAPAPQQTTQTTQTTQTAPVPQQATMDCQAMMQEQQKMMASVQAMDQKLEALANEMNRASGPDKIDSMAAILNEMIGQRKAMRDGMMQHMQGGTINGMSDGTVSCPMMKAAEKAPAVPAGHQH